MRFLWITSLLALAVLPVAFAQDTSSLDVLTKMPKCALNCLSKLVSNTTCNITDQACMCASQSLQASMSTCVSDKCTIKEALVALNVTATTCNLPYRNRSQQYINISNAFGIISALFVIQRFAFKFYAKLDFGMDDWFTLLAIVSGVPDTVINACGVTNNGLGRDIWTLRPFEITRFSRYFFIMEILYFAEVCMLKMALLFFYMRIFPSGNVRRLLWGTVAFNLLFGVCFVVLAIFQCTPIKHYWVMWDGEHQGRCLNINGIAWSNAAISITLDGWMLAIPLWQLKALNLDWKRKVGVGMMFCVGTFVTVVSILRLKSLLTFGSHTSNPTWDFYDIGIWSTVEINVGIICVCMPSLRLWLVRLFPRLSGTSQKPYANYASNASRIKNRKTSRPLGNSVSLQGSTDHHPNLDPNYIAYQKSYTVEYGDNDEVQLVDMKHHDLKSARSDAS